MSDQEATATPSSSDERQQKTNQPERGGHRDRGRRRHPQQGQSQQQPRRPESVLNLDELRELVELIAQYGFTDFELEREGIRVRLRRAIAPSADASAGVLAAPAATTAPPAPVRSSAAPIAQTQSAATAAAQTTTQPEPEKVAVEEDLHVITSPSLSFASAATSALIRSFALSKR
jgi:hypothetical protein